MKNVVECKREFFAYFNALLTRGVSRPDVLTNLPKTDVQRLAEKEILMPDQTFEPFLTS